MTPSLRVLVTPPARGRRNVALDEALIASHRDGRCNETLRFLTFRPSVLVGRHQDLSREVDVAYCRSRDIDIGRRVTGGGALYLDPGQLGWELVISRAALARADLGAVATTICEAVCRGLESIGIPASFRPRNDIEIDGRKIGGTGGFFDGDTLFYQGTLLLSLDPTVMFRALRVAPEKRARHAAEAASRVTSLAAVLGEACPATARIHDAISTALADTLGYREEAGVLSDEETELARKLYREEIGTRDFVHEIDGAGDDDGWRSATRDTAGGLVTASVKTLAGSRTHLEAVLLSGDFFVTPPRVIYDLEAALKQCALDDVQATVRRCLAASGAEMMSIGADEISASIVAAATG